MSSHNILSSSSKGITGIGYDPSIGPRSTAPSDVNSNPQLSNSYSGSQLQSQQQQQMRSSIISSTTTLNSNISSNGNSTLSSSGTLSNNNNNNNSNSNSGSNSIYDRNLNRNKHSISLSSLSFLFCEIVSNTFNNSSGLSQIEKKLSNLGYKIGLKYLELISFRDVISMSNKSNPSKRQIKVLDILMIINNNLFNNLFGKPADSLERSQEDSSQYMIYENIPMLSQFISIPKEYESLNVNSFIAGIIEGILDCAYFPADVSAHTVPSEEFPLRTVYLVKFHPKVVKREEIRNLKK
ncbi:hypothetical protein B5S28_g1682 [[Candida] boidinii]|nr:hypothetical protein B5S28_g1682 [[Candida] boidinii]OWB61998.1 hypothetical protein B5S29_g2908 [[Candida] boidinii]OWB72967.1 hypothetical protein B5S31_g2696 [[Candida] boidinii]OWB78772.1 hypothetical protein B5S32_g2974 [[Candida] boidinii]GMF06680.1 unnamed protein product [[Candida] boidinii]